MFKKLNLSLTQIEILLASVISGVLIHLAIPVPPQNPCIFLFGEPEYPSED